MESGSGVKGVGVQGRKVLAGVGLEQLLVRNRGVICKPFRGLYLFMKQDCEQPELEHLSLAELLQERKLKIEELLGSEWGQGKIKRSLGYFVEYCVGVPEFGERLIVLGLKTAVDGSTGEEAKRVTYVAADILTSESEEVAGLYIGAGRGGKEQLGLEDIESDTAAAQQQERFEKYRFLKVVLDYLQAEHLDENCLNYIAKALQVLVRRRITQFLEFFSEYPAYLVRVVELAQLPCMAQLLAKLVTDDEEQLSEVALKVKEEIVRLVLEKIRKDVGKGQTGEILGCIEDVLNSTRYGDLKERTPLQRMLDEALSQGQISFHLQKLMEALESQEGEEGLYWQAVNAAGYLGIVVGRMNMDEQEYSLESVQEFKPTQVYEVEQLYASFCGLVVGLARFWHYRGKFESSFWLSANKVVEPLMLMSRHSRFGSFYSKAPRQARQSALQALIHITCQCELHGILLQSVTTLLEKMLVQEQKMMESSNLQACGEAVFPGELYAAIAQHAQSIGVVVKRLLEESTSQRNRNQNGIFFRKILLLLENYFKHTAVVQRYPSTGSLQSLFPSFNLRNCKLFAEKAAILNHPDGKSVKQISQFEFIHKNNVIIRSLSPQLEEQSQAVRFYSPQGNLEIETRPFEIVFNLEGKLKALKQRVKQKQVDKTQVIQASELKENTNMNQQNGEQPNRLVQEKQGNPKAGGKKDETGANFFVKHLTIY